MQCGEFICISCGALEWKESVSKKSGKEREEHEKEIKTYLEADSSGSAVSRDASDHASGDRTGNESSNNSG